MLVVNGQQYNVFRGQILLGNGDRCPLAEKFHYDRVSKIGPLSVIQVSKAFVGKLSVFNFLQRMMSIFLIHISFSPVKRRVFLLVQLTMILPQNRINTARYLITLVYLILNRESLFKPPDISHHFEIKQCKPQIPRKNQTTNFKTFLLRSLPKQYQTKTLVNNISIPITLKRCRQTYPPPIFLSYAKVGVYRISATRFLQKPPTLLHT